MPEELPERWIKTTLSEIAEPSRERALPEDVPEMPYVGLEHIEPQTMKLLGHGYAREARSSSVRFSRGDVLYGKMRPYLNKVWVAEFDGLCSAEFLVFPKSDELNSQFLAHRLNAEDFVSFANRQISGERPRVDFEKLAPFPIALPPTPEQDRIVAKLEATLSGIERGEAAARRAQERLKNYRAAVLNAAITGELTSAWRDSQRQNEKSNIETGEALLHRLRAVRREHWEDVELNRLRSVGKDPKDDKWKVRYPEPVLPKMATLPTLPANWTWASIEQISTRVTVGYVGQMKSEYVASGIPFLRSQNVRANRFDPEGLLFITPEFHAKLSKSRLLPGDVVVVRSGSVGTTCVIPESLGEANCSDLVIIQRPLIESHFIAFYMNSAARKHVEAGKVGIALTHFNTASVAALAIPLPPLPEQAEIVREVWRRLMAADRLATTLDQQLERARATRQSLLREAFAGRLVPQNLKDENASVLLERINAEKVQRDARRKEARQMAPPITKKRRISMKDLSPSPKLLNAAWERIGKETDARRLFDEAGFSPEHVEQFYEVLRAAPVLREAFQEEAQRHQRRQKPPKVVKEKVDEPKGRFRLIDLWLKDFRNLKDYTVHFGPSYGLDVVLGWNGTGKSNLFEALFIIFRDLHNWVEKNRPPDKPMKGYRISYEIDEHIVEVTWEPGLMKRPKLLRGPINQKAKGEVKLESIKREQLPLPRFVFGYYSGPTNRLCEHFLPMEQAHYDRLRDAKNDDAETLARLLEQRRFFCAETHHAKYVLLAFSYKEDTKMSEFLEDRLRITGFESALFIIRKPRWAKPGAKAEDFWGATGIMRRVMERLKRYAIAPMVLKQTVKSGYRSTTEDHYYFFLPDLKSLHSFAAEYQDARTFFLALESTDFSELIHDVKIRIRVKSTNTEQAAITFNQLSEGEQQLLMVLGLMRFTKSHQSLVLLDEPDTHLNPHWSVKYLKDLTRVMSDNALQSPEQQTSQILIATHDPLVIASLVKEQIHLLKRDSQTGACMWAPASINPRGLGFTGILTSEMFGFRSDLDPETLADLDNRVRLIGKEGTLTAQEKEELVEIEKRLDEAGFSKAFSDPYYAAFVRAWSRKHSELMAGVEFLTTEKRQEIDRIANQVLEEATAEVEKEVSG